MATLNRKIRYTETTHEGAPAVKIDALAQLERSVMSCLLWEKEFYEDGKSIGDRISLLVKQLCNGGQVEDVANVAIQAKRDMRLRHVPLLLARELVRSKEGRKQLAKVIPEVITRPDDITEILAMYFADNKPKNELSKSVRSSAKLPNQLKKYLAESFTRFDEYQLAKYNLTGKAVSLKDAIRLTHPKPSSPEQAELWRKLVKDELKTPDTWEVEISQSKDKQASWTRLIDEEKLGGLATLRNIRNMVQANVDPTLIRQAIKNINAGRLLPINFISAAKHNPQFEPMIEKKFLECFTGKEKIEGKTIILVDISGSMDYNLSDKGELTRIDVACSLAMIGAELFNDLRIFTFSNDIKEVSVRHGFALREAITNSQSHGGTNLGHAVKQMPKDVRLIVITDEQSHDPVEQRKGYMINVASNKNGVGYRQWVHVDGWSDRVLNYIVQYEKNLINKGE